MSDIRLPYPAEGPPPAQGSPVRLSSVTQGSTEHWRVVNTIFSKFTDAQISAVLLPLLRSRPEALRQRVLVAALSLAHSELGESINSSTSSPGSPSAARSPSSPSTSSSCGGGVNLPRNLLHPLSGRELRGANEPCAESSASSSTLRLLGRDSVGFAAPGEEERPAIAHQFRIVNDSSEQFTVNISSSSTPSCDCPAFVSAPDFCCEHILFVYVQVLRLPTARQAVAEALRRPKLFERIESDQAASRSHQCPVCFKPGIRGPSLLACSGCDQRIYHKTCHNIWLAHYRQLAEAAGASGHFVTLPGTAPPICACCAPPVIRLVETNGAVLKIVTEAGSPL
ncbi:hypothetical protein FOL47_005543 [Perkinsus chesapeaki]|uniref:SWIM-type domain-containing protein n=1 Tax=Perkinsus chesapeaki TaxID=330153 RepID=A0A7J6LX91_PERCH|nr:hypothetical protein FOL47_005543 [Perkinsus chesapeaki]